MKFNTLILSLTIVCGLYHTVEAAIIKNSSYYIIKTTEKNIRTGGTPMSKEANIATFYDADGNELCKIKREEDNFFKLKDNLDPDAPKPKPVSYAIRYWPAISIGFGMRKGAPGYFIVFADKHGNHIKSYRYNERTKQITASWTPLHLVNIDRLTELNDIDASECIEIGSDIIENHDEI